MSLLTVPSNKYEKQPTSCNCRDTEEEFWIKEKKTVPKHSFVSLYVLMTHCPGASTNIS